MMAFQRIKCRGKLVNSFDSEAESNFRQKWSEDDCIRFWYLLYRILVTLYFWSSIIYTWVDTKDQEKYLIYMTNWGICLINVTTLFETIISICLYVNWNVSISIKKVNCIMCYMSYSLAVFITILYWSLLYDGGPHPSYINLYVHGLQGLFVVVDLLVSNKKWYIEKMWTAFPVPAVYVIFNVIYWAAGGTDPFGNPYVYSVLDWGNDPEEAVIVLALGIAILPFLHTALWLITFMRNRTHSMIYRKRSNAADSAYGFDNTSFTVTA